MFGICQLQYSGSTSDGSVVDPPPDLVVLEVDDSGKVVAASLDDVVLSSVVAVAVEVAASVSVPGAATEMPRLLWASDGHNQYVPPAAKTAVNTMMRTCR